MWFCISILLVITMIFLAYAKWRWLPKLLHRISSGRGERIPETESLRKLREDNVITGFESYNNAVKRMQGGKFRRLIAIIISHIVVYFFLLLLYWRYIVPNPYGSPERYFSPKVRYIILLCMVVIVFPLVSVVLEIGRRKARRKKQNDISAITPREKSVE